MLSQFQFHSAACNTYTVSFCKPFAFLFTIYAMVPELHILYAFQLTTDHNSTNAVRLLEYDSQIAVWVHSGMAGLLCSGSGLQHLGDAIRQGAIPPQPAGRPSTIPVITACTLIKMLAVASS